ncbi:MAG: YIP1 family protein [Rhodoferax sp.]
MNVFTVFTHTGLLQKGWTGIESDTPAVWDVFLKLVAPLSLLPAGMLWYAGTHYGDALAVGYGSKPWAQIAVLFYMTELVTVALMGWLIGALARAKGVVLPSRHAYLIAGVSPVPLWLSSLALVVPNIWVSVAASGIALVLSFRLIALGVQRLCHIRDEVVYLEMAHTIMAAGLIAWALLLLGVVAA